MWSASSAPILIFWKTGAESQQLAESSEADMLMMWTAAP